MSYYPSRRTWQRRSFIAASFIAISLGGVFALDAMRRQPLRPLVLETAINPNTALAASLMRLQGIGAARAEAIVWLRQSVEAVGGRQPFNSAEDLQRVRGIGPKTSSRLSESLEFGSEDF